MYIRLEIQKIQKFHFLNKICETWKKTPRWKTIQWGLQILIRTFFDRIYILFFDFKNTIENEKFYFLTKICEIRNKRWNSKSFTQIKSTIVFSYCDIWEKIKYRNVYRTSSTKHACHDKNVFLKADRALSKLNFLFHLKSNTYLVTLSKCNSHLQYYKINMSFSIKFQKIKLYVCEEYNITRCIGYRDKPALV